MIRQRYLIVEHPHQFERVGYARDGKLVNTLPIHRLMGSYHWSRLDSTHVLVYGNYPVGLHNEINTHALAVILPHISSSKTIHAHCVGHGKQRMGECLLGAAQLSTKATMGDFADVAESVFGPLFSPEK